MYRIGLAVYLDCVLKEFVVAFERLETVDHDSVPDMAIMTYMDVPLFITPRRRGSVLLRESLVTRWSV